MNHPHDAHPPEPDPTDLPAAMHAGVEPIEAVEAQQEPAAGATEAGGDQPDQISVEQADATETDAGEVAFRPPPPRPPRPKPPRTLPIFIGVIAVAAVIGLLAFYYGPGSDVRPFRKHLPEFIDISNVTHVRGEPPGVRGKVVIIDADTREIDELTFQLPDDLRPARPSDVRTVVLRQKQHVKEYGHYTDEQLAFVQVWRLVLIDRTTHTLYHWTDVDGPPPRAKVQTLEGNQLGPPPKLEMLQAISQLKRLP